MLRVSAYLILFFANIGLLYPSLAEIPVDFRECIETFDYFQNNVNENRSLTDFGLKNTTASRTPFDNGVEFIEGETAHTKSSQAYSSAKINADSQAGEAEFQKAQAISSQAIAQFVQANKDNGVLQNYLSSCADFLTSRLEELGTQKKALKKARNDMLISNIILAGLSFVESWQHYNAGNCGEIKRDARSKEFERAKEEHFSNLNEKDFNDVTKISEGLKEDYLINQTCDPITGTCSLAGEEALNGFKEDLLSKNTLLNTQATENTSILDSMGAGPAQILSFAKKFGFGSFVNHCSGGGHYAKLAANLASQVFLVHKSIANFKKTVSRINEDSRKSKEAKKIANIYQGLAIGSSLLKASVARGQSLATAASLAAEPSSKSAFVTLFKNNSLITKIETATFIASGAIAYVKTSKVNDYIKEDISEAEDFLKDYNGNNPTLAKVRNDIGISNPKAEDVLEASKHGEIQQASSIAMSDGIINQKTSVSGPRPASTVFEGSPKPLLANKNKKLAFLGNKTQQVMSYSIFGF